MEPTALWQGLAESFPSPAYDQIHFPTCLLTEDEFWFKRVHFFENLLSASGNEKCGFLFLVLIECQVFCLVLFSTKHLAPEIQCLGAKLPRASLPSVCTRPSRPSARLDKGSCPLGPCGCGPLFQPPSQLVPGASSSGVCLGIALRCSC